MKILAYVTTGLHLVTFPSAVVAQVTQSYSYDANGRLTGVVTTGGASAHRSAYAYDGANNRTSRSQTSTTAWAAITRLPTDHLLQPHEALVSPDGRYSFALRASGRLELWSGEAPDTADSRALVAAFRLTDDGQARFLSSLPATAASAGVWVSLRDNGGLAMLDGAGEEVWKSAEATYQEAAQ